MGTPLRTAHQHGKAISMNGNAYNQTNGRGASAPPQQISNGTRTKVTFDPPRVPVFLIPEAVPANPVPGKNGPQFMWLFEENQIAWFDPDVHAEMCACLEMNPEGTELAITKHVRRGTPPRFEVQPVCQIEKPGFHTPQPQRREATQPGGFDPPPPSGPRHKRLPPMPPPLNETFPERQRTRPATVHVERAPEGQRQTTPPKFHYEEAIERETAPPASQLEKALIEAITAAHAASAVATANGIKFEPTSAQFIELAKIILKLEDSL